MKSVSLVIIDTENYILANEALERSISQFNFKEILIFTDIPEKWKSGKIIEINKIKSIFDYNRFLLKNLSNFITTEFTLVIQYDGFILNSENFDPRLFNFDYTGACWNTSSGPIIGNGGFSLRSLKLLEACSEFPYFNYQEPEDVSICWLHRKYFESIGINFSPTHLANRFSMEHLVLNDTFGFHGAFHLPIIYQNEMEFLVNNLPERLLKSNTHIEQIINFLNSHDSNIAQKFLKLISLRNKSKLH
jgi:hypothetical protein